MKGYLVLLAFLGLSAGAPQNWPYRDSLMPYRYGYPSQSQYKYLPQIEDDEDIGPYPGMGRQDFVVGSDGQSSSDYKFRLPLYSNKAWLPRWKIGDRVRPTTEASAVSGVVETGSVAPVVEPSKQTPSSPSAPPPPPPRPVGPSEAVGKPVQPPAFPPARPPPTPPPKEDPEEDEDDDESDEDADDEDNDDTFDEGAEEEHQQDNDAEDDDEEEEEEEERRRQEPLNSEEKVEDAQPAVPVAPVNPPAPIVVDPVVVVSKNKSVVASSVSSPESVEEVNVPASVESNEVVKPQESDDESSEEQGFGDGVEALVPGYVTDQGEVLVPVDTVTGDQPISIVPDPYSPTTRGVPISGSPNYRFSSYNNPYFFSNVYDDSVGRQESEDNKIHSASAEESSEIGPEGRNEFLTAFPPSRTPELYAVINSGYPPASDYDEFPQYQPSQGKNKQKYGPVMAYRVKQAKNPKQTKVSVKVKLSSSQEKQYIRNPSIKQKVRNPYIGQNEYFLQRPNVGYSQVQNPFFENFLGSPYDVQPIRKPYNPYVQLRNPYIGQYVKKPYVGPSYGHPDINRIVSNTYINRYINRPSPHALGPYSVDFQAPHPAFAQGYRGPVPVYAPSPFGGPFGGGYGPRPPFPPYGSPYGPRPPYAPKPFKPQPLRRPRPPVAHTNKPTVVSKPSKVVVRKPTPVEHQDDHIPYMYEDPHAYQQYSPEMSNESSGQSDYVENTQRNAPKSRRAAKMAKKVTKKDKPKKVSDVDPLNILKKIHVKKS